MDEPGSVGGGQSPGNARANAGVILRRRERNRTRAAAQLRGAARVHLGRSCPKPSHSARDSTDLVRPTPAACRPQPFPPPLPPSDTGTCASPARTPPRRRLCGAFRSPTHPPVRLPPIPTPSYLTHPRQESPSPRRTRVYFQPRAELIFPRFHGEGQQPKVSLTENRPYRTMTDCGAQTIDLLSLGAPLRGETLAAPVPASHILTQKR